MLRWHHSTGGSIAASFLLSGWLDPWPSLLPHHCHSLQQVTGKVTLLTFLLAEWEGFGMERRLPSLGLSFPLVSRVGVGGSWKFHSSFWLDVWLFPVPSLWSSCLLSLRAWALLLRWFPVFVLWLPLLPCYWGDRYRSVGMPLCPGAHVHMTQAIWAGCAHELGQIHRGRDSPLALGLASGVHVEPQGNPLSSARGGLPMHSCGASSSL